jgi:hypothetical protein
MLTVEHPVYIPSKGRADVLHTAKMFDRDGVPYRVVVQPDQVEAYAAFADRLLVLPEDGRGLVYARNWIKDHARSEGHSWHWQFDDDVMGLMRVFRGFRIPCSARAALAIAEQFVDRYSNVMLASFNSEFFVPTTGVFAGVWPPFFRNFRCYTCFLMNVDLPNRWRGRYNEDTDMTLQVLADGYCTVLFNAFVIRTPKTMTDSGGQTSIYVHDGRLRMARELERRWPGVVSVKRKFQRPQHHVAGLWRKFDTPMKLKPGVDLAALAPVDEMGLTLTALEEPRSEDLRRLLKESRS